ncbi:MAG: HD domain-containing protein [Chloroflexi bacterium]|nr:HD domain-containing protein [Chloroflexota bacterium]
MGLVERGTMITPTPFDRPMYWPELVETLQSLLENTDVYLVGGIIRDVYLRRPVHDLDLATPGDGRPVARRIANALQGDYYALDAGRGVGRAIVNWQDKRWTIDVAQFRRDDLLGDLKDRDFTANAVAAHLHDLDKALDPLGGLEDIRNRLVRLCDPASIANDPVRALRAVRLSLSHGMRLTPQTKQAIRHDGPTITAVSPERLRDAFFRLLAGPKVMAGIMLLDALDLLPFLLPETLDMKAVTQSPPHIFDVWRHTMAVLAALEAIREITLDVRQRDEAAANFGLGMIAFALAHLRGNLQTHLEYQWPSERPHHALLFLAALAHDTGKPPTRSVDEAGQVHFYRHEEYSADIAARWGANLALSNDEIERLHKIVRHHMRPQHLERSGMSRRALYRYWRDLGAAGVDICLLAMADVHGKYGPRLPQEPWLALVQTIQRLLDGYYQEHETLVQFTPLLDGNQLMRHLDLQPGPIVGRILAALREAQALQEIRTSAEALNWAKSWLENHKGQAH